MLEEMWPRYGSFPGFNPIVELSMTFHNLVVGANGQRQAMFLENVSGLAERIVRNFDITREDAALIIEQSRSNPASGKKLQDFADFVLDTGAPAGDAMVRIDGLDTPVAPGSTVGGCMVINALKSEIAALLTRAGQPPKVLSAAATVGAERAKQLFESAYDEHARRLARLYEHLGEKEQSP
jgi:uncharacterized phosphosugar-binding protein